MIDSCGYCQGDNHSKKKKIGDKVSKTEEEANTVKKKKKQKWEETQITPGNKIGKNWTEFFGLSLSNLFIQVVKENSEK